MFLAVVRPISNCSNSSSHISQQRVMPADPFQPGRCLKHQLLIRWQDEFVNGFSKAAGQLLEVESRRDEVGKARAISGHI